MGMHKGGACKIVSPGKCVSQSQNRLFLFVTKTAIYVGSSKSTGMTLPNKFGAVFQKDIEEFLLSFLKVLHSSFYIS